MAERETDEWTLTYTDWDPDQQPLREALCTLGNGLFATRGAAEEVRAGGPHYPGTYLSGGFNRLETDIAGHVLENEDLVNWPNWLCLTFRPEGGEWFRLDAAKTLDFRQELDVRCGLLVRQIKFQDAGEREFSLISRRLVSMANPHLAAICWELTAENWSGTIEVRSALDGTVKNENVARYRDLDGQHLRVLETGQVGEDGIFLTVETVQSHIRMTQAARTRVYRPYHGETAVPTERTTQEEGGWVAQHLRVHCEQHKPLRIEKIVALHTSRDFAISDARTESQKVICRTEGFEQLLGDHQRAWRELWNRADIELQGDSHQTQFILRLHLFHLLQTTSMHTIERDAGVPSRGLHGEAYRGHILWDELFIFPILTLRIPELTRALLMYRFRRLPEARCAARQAGYRGAMFPWQSGSDGREESQVLHLNPRSGRWVPDNSQIQRHVNAAIAWNVWQYFQTSGDAEFLSFYGAELLLEIARFWASIADCDSHRDRYEIRGVMGPDEFHTGYPGADQPGLDNNAYTNVMAAWVLRTAGDVLRLLGEDRAAELQEQLELDDEELSRWDEVSRKMFVPFHDDGIISQFEGYEKLEEFDWEGYREKHGDIHRLDRILEAEDDDVNRYKASKQADVLMLFYLFSADQLRELFERMGYQFDPQTIPRNVDYYLQRTSHGSTLSRVVHSWVLARAHRPQAWDLFLKALHSDIEDIQGGTTSEGIHLGAMAGTVDLIQRCHTGIEVRSDVLWLDPRLPDALSQIHLRIRYRGHWLRLHVTHQELCVAFEKGWRDSVQVGFRDEVHTMKQGEERVFELRES